jgi:hypothetical protein
MASLHDAAGLIRMRIMFLSKDQPDELTAEDAENARI